jgi:hypothetical protein
MISESLVELVELHPDEIAECFPFQFRQPSMGQLVLDERPMEPTMFRQASVAQQSAYQHLLLPTCQYVWS